jgi:hypothetical protein
LPNDSLKLRRISGVHPAHWPRVWGTVGAFFTTMQGGKITNDDLAARHKMRIVRTLSLRVLTAVALMAVLTLAQADGSKAGSNPRPVAWEAGIFSAQSRLIPTLEGS